jgi:invasion protein IalB
MTSGPRLIRNAAGGLFALSLALNPGTAFCVAYVLYYHTFGDWAVVCWRGMVEGEKSCFIDAPPIAFNTDPLTSAVHIEPAGDGVAIVISARSGTRLGVKVRLIVDGKSNHEGTPDRLDHVNFQGTEAAAIVDEFRKGHTLAVELPELKRAIHLSLIGFEDAYTAFQENLDRFEAPHP